MRLPFAMLFTALAIAFTASVARAQNQPVAEAFTTADGVKLKGLFHASPFGATQNHAVVVLLYQPGVGNSMAKPGNWDALTVNLVRAGFHVFQFDWRGHGLSTALANPLTFWNNALTGRWNAKIKGADAKPVKNAIDVKEFDPKYTPAYALDLAAARMHLDSKNDQNAVNTGSIYLIGAGDTAAIGTLWMAAEWLRPAVCPNVNQLGNAPRYEVIGQQLVGGVGVEAGNDIAGAIWLSASRPAAIRERDLTAWSKNTLKLRSNNPMLYLYGKQDAKGEADCRFYFDQVLVAKGNKPVGLPALEQTFLKDVAGTKLNGVNLIGNDVGTEDLILKYLTALQKARAAIVRKPRNFTDPYYINLGQFGLMP